MGGMFFPDRGAPTLGCTNAVMQSEWTRQSHYVIHVTAATGPTAQFLGSKNCRREDLHTSLVLRGIPSAPLAPGGGRSGYRRPSYRPVIC